MAEPLDQALDLLRRLPPAAVAANLETIVAHCPALADDLYSAVDQPLAVRIDHSPEGAGREYLACDYNRDADSWRSPWSSTYDPPLPPDEGDEAAAEGTQPSPELRRLEILANEAFGTYRQLCVCLPSLWHTARG
jgi:capping protein beta